MAASGGVNERSRELKGERATGDIAKRDESFN